MDITDGSPVLFVERIAKDIDAQECEVVRRRVGRRNVDAMYVIADRCMSPPSEAFRA